MPPEDQLQPQLLDPQTLSELGDLDVISLRVVEGLISGIHRSPYRGSSVEFAEHRMYTPGDEVRAIDWRTYAKRDRYYIKEYEAETNAPVTFVLDASGSMGFGMSTITKFRYAQIALVCLARLALHQRDAVGFVVSGSPQSGYLPPRALASQLSLLIHMMGSIKPAEDHPVASALDILGRRQRRRGLVIVASDCFEPTPTLMDALHGLQVRGQDVILLHIMAPEELSFAFNRWSRFISLESPLLRREVDPASIRKKYLASVSKFLGEVKKGCGESGIHYIPVSTDQSIGTTLFDALRMRGR